MNFDVSQIPVVILAGGKGIYIDETGVRKAKGEVRILGESLLNHVIQIYLNAGFKKFIISGDYRISNQLDQLKTEFSLNKIKDNLFSAKHSSIDFQLQYVEEHSSIQTAERIFKLKNIIGEESRFCLTYSDTISTINILQMFAWHLKNKKAVTLLATKLPTRFRVLGIRSSESQVRGFADKAFMPTYSINGGFYFIESQIWSYFNSKSSVFEKDVLESLMEKNQLESFSFSGLWQYIDSERDLPNIESVVQENKKNRLKYK